MKITKPSFLFAVLICAVAFASASVADECSGAKCEKAAQLASELQLTQEQQTALMGAFTAGMQQITPLVPQLKEGEPNASVDAAFITFESMNKAYNVLTADQKLKLKTIVKSNPEAKKFVSGFSGKLSAFVGNDGTIKPEIMNEAASFITQLSLTEAQINDYTMMFVTFVGNNTSVIAAAMNGNSDSAVDASFAAFEFVGTAYNKLTADQKAKLKTMIKSDPEASKFVGGLVKGFAGKCPAAK